MILLVEKIRVFFYVYPWYYMYIIRCVDTCIRAFMDILNQILDVSIIIIYVFKLYSNDGVSDIA